MAVTYGSANSSCRSAARSWAPAVQFRQQLLIQLVRHDAEIRLDADTALVPLVQRSAIRQVARHVGNFESVNEQLAALLETQLCGMGRGRPTEVVRKAAGQHGAA